MAKLDFLCRAFDVKEALADVPLLVLKILLTNNTNEDLCVPPLAFDVKLLGINKKSISSSYKEEGWLGTSTSKTIFMMGKKSALIEISVPLNSQRLERLLDIRHKNELVGFEIWVEGLAFAWSPIESGTKFALQIPDQIQDKVRYNLPEGPIDKVVLMSEQFNDIIEKLKHYELLHFEIPVKEPKDSAQKCLNEAIKLLHDAKDDLIHNNLESALLAVRNALFNCLLENQPNSTKTPPEKVLKHEIKDFVANNVPSDTRPTYEEIIKDLDVVLRKVKDILSRFVHEGSDKLKQAPLRQDVELCYFLTLLVIRRLSYQAYG